MKHKLSAIVLGLCLLATTAPAYAQIARLGQTFLVWNGVSRGSAVAYDSRNGVYLVVAAHGALIGRFVSADGGLIGEPFVVQGVAGFAQFPHVAFSPDANGGNGAFLVTWHESDASVPSLHARLVAYPSGPIGADLKIVGNDTYWEVMGAPVVYSTVSKEFLVVWRQYSDTNIWGLRLGLSGAPLGGAIPVATSALFESDPSLTYNPQTDEYFAVYRQGFGTVNIMGQRIKAGTGALPAGPSVLAQAATVNTTGVTYNPQTGQYLAAWHQMPGDVIVGRVIGGDGTPVGNASALSSRYGTYDSLSVDASPVSGTTLLVGHDRLSVEDGGVEITAGGVPTSGGMQITGAGGTGNFYPRLRSNASRGEWLVTAANQFARMIAQRVQTSTPGGGQPPPPPPPPPPPVDTKLYLDSPGPGSLVQQNFAVAGWAVELASAAGAGTGVPTVHVWAYPLAGAPVFLGATNMGVGRPDIAAYFGRSDFGNAGFGLSATLPAGTYDIVAYAFSAVAGKFNATAVRRVTVVSNLLPVPNPKMFVDSPAFGSTVQTLFSVGGSDRPRVTACPSCMCGLIPRLDHRSSSVPRP
jgi:hypothetical protein